jgi:hypothetical protein
MPRDSAMCRNQARASGISSIVCAASSASWRLRQRIRSSHDPSSCGELMLVHSVARAHTKARSVSVRSCCRAQRARLASRHATSHPLAPRRGRRARAEHLEAKQRRVEQLGREEAGRRHDRRLGRLAQRTRRGVACLRRLDLCAHGGCCRCLRRVSGRARSRRAGRRSLRPPADAARSRYQPHLQLVKRRRPRLERDCIAHWIVVLRSR